MLRSPQLGVLNMRISHFDAGTFFGATALSDRRYRSTPPVSGPWYIARMYAPP